MPNATSRTIMLITTSISTMVKARLAAVGCRTRVSLSALFAVSTAALGPQTMPGEYFGAVQFPAASVLAGCKHFDDLHLIRSPRCCGRNGSIGFCRNRGFLIAVEVVFLGQVFSIGAR